MRAEAFWLTLGTVDASPVPVDTDPALVDPRTGLEAMVFADRNGLYYPFVRAWTAGGGIVPPSQSARWELEQTNRERLRNTLGTLNRAARQARVPYAVIKNTSILDPVPRDVDILIQDDDRDSFFRALRSEGMTAVSQDEAEYSFAGGERLRVDVYGRIHYLGRDFLPVHELLASVTNQFTHGIEHPALSPASSFLVNSVHGLLGHAAVSLLDFLDLFSSERALGDLRAVRARASAMGWGTVLDLWLDHIESLRRRVYDERRIVRFPARHERGFVLDCVTTLEGDRPRGRARTVLGWTLLWDDLLFYVEEAGLESALKRSRATSALANVVGHRLRVLRGDSKTARPTGGKDALGRTRTWFR